MRPGGRCNEPTVGSHSSEVTVTRADLLNIANALGNGMLWVAFACAAGGVVLKVVAVALR